MAASRLQIYLVQGKRNKQWRWYAERNGKKVAWSGESYHNRKDCLTTLRATMSALWKGNYDIHLD